MLQEKLRIDEKDALLLSSVMANPAISQQELASLLQLSQPSVNVRLHKLKNRGVLVQAAGIDANKSGLALVRVDFTCANAKRLLAILSKCSFFVNGFIMSGTRNVSVFLLGEDLAKTDHIVDKYLRSNPHVQNIELSVIVSTAKEFICSVDIEKEHSEPCANPDNCDDCTILHDVKS